MKRFFAVVAGVAVSAGAFADPVVVLDSVAPTGRTVTVHYTLKDAPAVITLGVETNAAGDAWLPVGGKMVRRVTGHVNRRLAPGSYWVKWISEDNLLAESVGTGKARVVVKAWALDNPPDYIVFNLMGSDDATKTHSVRFYESLDHLPRPITDEIFKRYWYAMRRIPAKGVVWRRGSPTTEANHDAAETPHYVKLTQDYYIGVYLMTDAHYKHYYYYYEQEDYGSGKVLKTPVLTPSGCMNYNTVRGADSAYVWPESGHDVDPTKILGTLRTRFPGYDFDLATCAQWEFACRAGAGTRYYWGDAAANLQDPDDVFFRYAWASTGHSVGLKEPNAFGLYDMIGLAREVCLDWLEIYPNVTDPEHPVEDPKGPSTEDHTLDSRSARGLTSTYEPYLRIAIRMWDESPSRYAVDTGLRPVIPAVIP